MTAHIIWFWQRIVSPHMAGLAVALSELGCDVTYVTEKLMSDERASQGWKSPGLDGVDIHFIDSEMAVRELVELAPADAEHICQGIRANGRVKTAQQELAKRGRSQWVIFETVEEHGWRAMFKRLEYRRLFTLHRHSISGVLAIGYKTSDWITARGMPSVRVFPFAYFLQDNLDIKHRIKNHTEVFRFMFVGQLIELKRLELLMQALSELQSMKFELVVIGAGPQEERLHKIASTQLPERVTWRGQLPMNEVRQEMAQADCLVLPSRHDGWGAVVSEALMVGTPVICSDACGAAGVVTASGVGGVFRSGITSELVALLRGEIRQGCVDKLKRRSISQWAESLGAVAGAMYLCKILDYHRGLTSRPTPPWVS